MTRTRQLPRNIAGAVVRGADFFGRKDEVDALWRLVDRGSVLITAPRRYGKSSLMYAILDDPRPGWRVTLIDVEYVSDPAEFVTTMAAELLRHEPIRRGLQQLRDIPRALGDWFQGLFGEVSVGVPDVAEIKLALRESMRHPDQWDVLAQQLMSQLARFEVDTLVILDEFPMMIANLLDRDESSALLFLKWFRALRQSSDCVRTRFVLGGSVNILPRLTALSSEALLNDLEYLHLRPFAENRALAFVSAVLEAKGVEAEPHVGARVLEVTRTGVPYYLQVVVSELLSYARREGRSVRVADVEPAYHQRVIGPENRHRFSHYHSRLHHHGPLEPISRAILGALVRQEPLHIDALRASPLLREVREEQIHSALVLLEGDYYIHPSADGVHFIDGLLRDWWRRNAPAPRLP